MTFYHLFQVFCVIFAVTFRQIQMRLPNIFRELKLLQVVSIQQSELLATLRILVLGIEPSKLGTISRVPIIMRAFANTHLTLIIDTHTATSNRFKNRKQQTFTSKFEVL